jgi:glycosyltransferase involved in cell wall biosynthesis
MSATRLLAITTSQEEGGAESHLRITLRAVQARGCEVHVALPHSAGTARLREDLLAAGCRVRTLPVGIHSVSRAGAYLALARDVLATLWAIARVRPNAVLLNLPTPEASPGAMLACALARVHTTAIFHLVRSDLVVTPRRRRLYRRAARGAQQWLCVSEDNRRTLAGQFGVAEQRIAVVRNGVPSAEVAAGAGELARAELQIADSATLVLTTGRLGEQKDHGVIVQALGELVSLDQSLVFVWAGDGPLREQLTRAVSATGLERHVRMLGRREDVPALLAAADLFLLPSRDEGGAPPFALAEAMLAGVPTVVSDIGALREIVEDGRNGVVFTRGDPEDLVRAISRALGDREALRQMAARARAQATREFTLARMTEGLLAHVLPEAQARSR